jgi:membrane protein involved in colicin uptake
MATSLERKNQDQEGKDPSWRQTITEPHEDAARAIAQQQSSNQRRQNPQRGSNNNQQQGKKGNNNAQNNQKPRKTQEQYVQDNLERIQQNPYNSRVIIQNTGETRLLMKIALDLDRKVEQVRQNMFSRLPGEYGVAALSDADYEINRLSSFARRLDILEVSERKGKKGKKKKRGNDVIKLNPEKLRRYNLASINVFIDEASRIKEKAKSVGYEGEVINQGLTDFLSELKAKIEADAKAEQEAKLKAEAEANAAREARAKEQAEAKALRDAEKAQRQAEWQAKQGANTASDNEAQQQTTNADLPSLTETAESNKPAKAKKEKIAA